MIGVFFDHEAMSYEYQTTSPNEEVTAYLLLIFPSDPTGVSGWECWVPTTGDPLGETWTLSAGLNVDDGAPATSRSASASRPWPCPPSPFVLLATWTGFIASRATS